MFPEAIITTQPTSVSILAAPRSTFGRCGYQKWRHRKWCRGAQAWADKQRGQTWQWRPYGYKQCSGSPLKNRRPGLEEVKFRWKQRGNINSI